MYHFSIRVSKYCFRNPLKKHLFLNSKTITALKLVLLETLLLETIAFCKAFRLIELVSDSVKNTNRVEAWGRYRNT